MNIKKVKNLVLVLLLSLEPYSCSQNNNYTTKEAHPTLTGKNVLNNSSSDSLYKLGIYYLENNDEIDTTKGFHCLRLSAKNGNSDAMTALGFELIESNRNIQEGLNYLREAEKAGNTGAMIHLARFYFNKQKKYKESIQLLSKADKLGNLQATYIFSIIYFEGYFLGDLPDSANKELLEINNGITLITKAADKGYGYAEKDLGYYYLNGLEGYLEPNRLQAKKYLVKTYYSSFWDNIPGALDEIEETLIKEFGDSWQLK